MTLLFFSAGGLLIGIFLCLEWGRRLGKRHLKDDSEARAGLGAVEGALFGLMGLLIAFTFSGASSRFDTRRQLIVEETNAIGTAYLRIDLLPPESQPALRQQFREYVDARIDFYQCIENRVDYAAPMARYTELQNAIWKGTVAATRKSDAPSSSAILIIPALNQMFDITTTRFMAFKMHPPLIIYFMLGTLTLVSATFAGYGMAGGKTRSWLHILGFAIILATTVYVILDLELPRLGLITLEQFDAALVTLRQSMK